MVTIAIATPEDDNQYSEHSEHPFCYDMSCPCHEDSESMNMVGHYVNDGLMTTSEADNLYRGRTM